MVERSEICWRKWKIKRKGKILIENGVKMGKNEGEIEGLIIEGLQRERGMHGRECAEVENENEEK